MNSLMRLLTVSSAGAFLAACNFGEDSLKWTEDVRLPDGRVVTLTRYQEFKGPHELGDLPTETDYWLQFKHPDTGQIVRWQSDRDLKTLALLMDGKTPLMLASPHFGSSMLRYKCPDPPYLLYRYSENGTWSQVPIREIPINRVRVNMTHDAGGAREEIKAAGRHLTAEHTSNSRGPLHEPYIINFKLMHEQTFTVPNCGRNLNYLTDPSSTQ